MDENTYKGLYTGAGVLFCITIIVVVGLSITKGRNLSTSASHKLDTTTASVQNGQYSDYDGQIISGTDIISLINYTVADKNNKVIVDVGTKAGSYTTYSSLPIGTNITTNKTGIWTNFPASVLQNAYTINDINNASYIEPTANFRGCVGTATNGSINFIYFAQQ